MIQSSVALMYPEFESQLSVADPLTPELIEQIYSELARNPRYDAHGNLIMSLQGIGLDKDIRYALLECIPHFSEIDVVMAGTDKNSNDAGLWIRNNQAMLKKRLSNIESGQHIIKTMFNNELLNIESGFLNIKFKGRGQKETPVITYAQVIAILSMLPSEFGRSLKQQLVNTGVRVGAGDQRMHDVINANASNTSDVHMMARVSVALDAVQETGMIMPPPVPNQELLVTNLRSEMMTIFAQMDEQQSKIKELEQRKLQDEQTLARMLKKTQDSERRKQLNDEKTVHKRKLEETDNASRVAVKEKKDISKLVVSEKEAIVAAEIRQAQEERLTIEAKAELERKQLQEERLNIEMKAQLELKQLEAKAELERKQLQEERLTIEAKAQLELKQFETKAELERKQLQEERLNIEAKAQLELKQTQEERLNIEAKAQYELKQLEAKMQQELEERKTVEAQTHQEIEERKKIEAQIELHKLMMMQQPASSGAKPGRPAKSVDPMELALANEPKVFTFLSVAEYNKIFSDVKPEQKAAILKRAPTDRFDVSKKVKSIGTIPEGPEGKMVDYFRKTDAPVLLRALEIAKRAVLEQEKRAIEEERKRLEPPIEYPECDAWFVRYMAEREKECKRQDEWLRSKV